MEELYKYPRTRHLEGSRKQTGDEDLNYVRFEDIRGKYLVLEEKIDGANCGISFGSDGKMYLQSRGHFLNGGYGEKQFDLFKRWAGGYQSQLWDILGDRYIMYGEWMYAKHSVYYDALPHYFLEFDIWDREKECFLDTPSRRILTAQMPVASVPVLKEGVFSSKKELLDLIGPSLYIRPGHMTRLREYCEREGLDGERQCQETDGSGMMEGLYLKVEEDGCVTERLKYVRASFIQCIMASDSHWLDRPIVPNQLQIPLEDIFMPELKHKG